MCQNVLGTRDEGGASGLCPYLHGSYNLNPHSSEFVVELTPSVFFSSLKTSSSLKSLPKLPYSNSSLSTEVSEFLLNCFVRSASWHLWLSLLLSLLFLLAMGANATLLITIQLEASLHEPMYYLLSLLSLLDTVLCLTIIPKVLAIFWFDLRSISFFATSSRCSLWITSCKHFFSHIKKYLLKVIHFVLSVVLENGKLTK